MGENNVAQRLVERLNDSGVIGKAGQLQFQLAGVLIDLESRDIVGGVIQEWLGHWMRKEGFAVQEPENSQEFPDFILEGQTLLEVKTFVHGKRPGFDVAAFPNYIESLNTRPERLNADYLVFSYEMTGSRVYLRGVWLRKVWELTGPSPTNILELQVKRGYPNNIRPKNFISSSANVFPSRRAFCQHLHLAASRFSPLIRGHDANWLDELATNFQAQTGSSL